MTPIAFAAFISAAFMLGASFALACTNNGGPDAQA